MIKFTDEFINEASYLYRLAETFSYLLLTQLDESEDELLIKRLNDIFRTKFSKSVYYLGDGYHKQTITAAMKNYLIGLSCMNENELVREFLDKTDLD